MTKLNVWIDYQPQIYTDLFTRLLQSFGGMNLSENHVQCSNRIDNGNVDWDTMDVIVLSLDERGKPLVDALPNPQPKAKYLAFSPCGERGMRRMPGAKRWEKLNPFGVDHLLREVFGELAQN